MVLDAGPIIKNEPSVSTLLAKAEKLITTPAVISEIRDSATRSRVQTTLLPFLELKQPNASAVKFVQDFARRTGDLAVLSRPDLEIIALAYELECEMNGGDWRLRKTPGQKRTNGPPPGPEQKSETIDQHEHPVNDDRGAAEESQSIPSEAGPAPRAPWSSPSTQNPPLSSTTESNTDIAASQTANLNAPTTSTSKEHLMSSLSLADNGIDSQQHEESAVTEQVERSSASDLEPDSIDSASDSEGWITPSNIKRRQLEEASPQETSSAEPKVMQVATITTDFALQNVLLQINLNLLSPSLQRVKHLKTFVLRCHACFQTTKDMTKQFCPRCGQPALTRVACSTNANGEFKLHLKKKMQWNHRGDRYSVPKPVSGASNGRVKGGGKGGWGNDLILAEDQKEYSRAVDQEKREKKIADLMDADYMPAMFSGSGKRDGRAGGRPRVGAGRTVNSKKR